MLRRVLAPAADWIARRSGVTARDERRLVRAAYAAILNRDPTDDEVAHWAGRLGEGTPWARFLTLLRNSPEAAEAGASALTRLDGTVEISLVADDPIPGAPLRFRASAADTVLLPSLLDAAGVWEPHMTRAVRALCGPGDRAVDAGANSGYFTVIMGALTGDAGRVVALEPADEPRRSCEENVSLNEQSRTTVLPFALWSERTTLQVRAVPWATTAAHVVTDPQIPLGVGEVATDVPCTTLDALQADGAFDGGRLSLVKLVVQGSEPQALRGMRHVVARHQPAIICQVNAVCLEALDQGPADVSRAIHALGYRMLMLPKDHQRAWAASLPAASEHPQLGLREVTDLAALIAASPATDDPVDIVALPR
ncbi:MAG: FkbM family methyltransferase [Actinobacteria bacterium]|nr:FkbM family methyltransferase [Actinomycetota bacterium]